MANKTPDFDTIWAANSPIGLYPLTTKEILQGWNFVGATPPPRSAFDAWMNRTDLKMQWMYNNMFSEDALAGFLYWRLPNTAYFVGEKVALQKEFDIYLECTTAGESSADQMLALPGEKKVGDALQDGTVQWVIRQKATTADIAAHNTDSTAHADFDWVKSLSAASDGLHFQTRNAQADTVLNLINTLQATLTQETVPTGNNGTILALLSGIIHQIKALSGKENWYDAPGTSLKDIVASLSNVSAISDYDVDDPNAWWVKLRGEPGLIIQGIKIEKTIDLSFSITLPISFSMPLLVTVSQPQYMGYSGPENNANAKVWRIHTLTKSGFSVKPDEWNDVGDGMIGIAYAFSVGII